MGTPSSEPRRATRPTGQEPGAAGSGGSIAGPGAAAALARGSLPTRPGNQTLATSYPGAAAGGPQLGSDDLPPHRALGTKRATRRPSWPQGREGPYMYSETGALDTAWAGGCRLLWLPRPLL